MVNEEIGLRPFAGRGPCLFQRKEERNEEFNKNEDADKTVILDENINDVLRNNVDVTDEYDASCFIWTRTSRDHDADLYWNSNHSNGAKVITITGNDVRMNADFQCKFEYENVTVVAG